MEWLNSMALSQTSMICRKVRSASCSLIHRKQLVLDSAKNQRMQPRTKIHPSSDDGCQFLAITEVLEADAFQNPRLKFSQHVHVAAPRIEIPAQHRTEKAQFANSAFSAETRNLFAVNRNGQFGNIHADIFAESGEIGNC